MPIARSRLNGHPYASSVVTYPFCSNHALLKAAEKGDSMYKPINYLFIKTLLRTFQIHDYKLGDNRLKSTIIAS